MAVNFPENPTLYQTYSEENETWIWNGEIWASAWDGAEWVEPESIEAGGSNTQVLFNDSGVANGSPYLVFDKDSQILTVSGIKLQSPFDEFDYDYIDFNGFTGTAENSNKLNGLYSSNFAQIDSSHSISNTEILFQGSNGVTSSPSLSFNSVSSELYVNGTIDGIEFTGKAYDSYLLNGLDDNVFFRKDLASYEDLRFTELDGVGIRFFDSNTSTIFVSDSSRTDYGNTISGDSTSDRNMYFRIGGGTNRGFVFETSYGSKLAGIHPDGTRFASGTITANSNLVWHAGNDGSGSGLDADLLDGLDSTQFFRSDTSNSGDFRFAGADGQGIKFWNSDNFKIFTSDTSNTIFGGRISGETTSSYNMYFRFDSSPNDGFVFETSYGSKLASINADGTRFSSGTIMANSNIVWHAGNDGSGSGLDADLLDGYNIGTSGSTIPLLNAINTWAANQTFSDTISVTNKLGVGISTPFFPVHVYGNNTIVTVENNNTSQYFGASIVLKGPAGTNRGTKLVHGNDNAGGTNSYFSIEDIDSSDAYLKTLALYNHASNFWSFLTNGTEKLKIDSSGVVTINTNVAWHAGNDGSGSGLDADLLDGLNSTAFAQLSGAQFTGSIGIGKAAESNLDIKADDNVTTTYPLWIQNSAMNYGTGYGAYGMTNRNIGGSSTTVDYTFDIGGNVIFNTAGSERMRINSSGELIIASTTSLTYGQSLVPKVQYNSTSSHGLGMSRWVSSSGGANFSFAKSRGATVGTRGVVSSGDVIANLLFDADDGTNFIPAASITASVDGTPGTNDMPGRLTFYTTADGASTLTERMRIDSSGAVTISGGTVWHSGNDGAGSGLDADLLDGLNSSSFVRTDADSTISSNKISFGSTIRQMVDLWSTSYGIGVQTDTLYLRTASAFSIHKGGTHSNTANAPGSGGTNLLHLDSSGNLGLGTGSPLTFLDVRGSATIGDSVNINAIGGATPPRLSVAWSVPASVGWSASSGTEFLLTRDTDCYMSIITASTGTCAIHFGDEAAEGSGRIQYTHSSNALTFRTNGTDRVVINSGGSLYPSVDNAQACGISGNRWSVIWAATGTINTSDEDTKDEISNIPDEWLDAWETVDWKRYKFKDSITEKGEEARWHIGIIAQRVRDAFANKGIDATTIGLLCYDEWEEETGKDDDGNIVVIKKAGSLWALRYDECFAMEAAYQRRRISRLEAKLNLA